MLHPLLIAAVLLFAATAALSSAAEANGQTRAGHHRTHKVKHAVRARGLRVEVPVRSVPSGRWLCTRTRCVDTTTGALWKAGCYGNACTPARSVRWR